MMNLTDNEVERYHADGFLHLPGLLDPERIAAVAAAVDRLPQTHAHLIHEDNIRIEFSLARPKDIWKWDPVIDICPEIAALAADATLIDVLTRIFRGSPPRLFKDKMILKPPGSQGNDLHQDYTWWQGFPDSLLTVTIAIDGGDEHTGCTELWPGMHRQGLFHEPGKMVMLDPAVVAGRPSHLFVSRPGDVALFHCLTPHRAGANRGDRSRRQLFLTYHDSAAGDLYQDHYQHFLAYRRAMLPPERRAACHLA